MEKGIPTFGKVFSWDKAESNLNYSEKTMDKIATLKQLVEQNPDNALFRYTLGYEYLKNNRFEEAIKHFQIAIQLNPNYTAAYRDLGKALQECGNNEKAEAIYQKGIEVGTTTGDLQTVKEIQVFLKRLQKQKT